MMVAGIFQAHADSKRAMDKAFKEKGFTTLKEKRAFLTQVLGYAPKFTEMTISQKEEVVFALRLVKR